MGRSHVEPSPRRRSSACASLSGSGSIPSERARRALSDERDDEAQLSRERRAENRRRFRQGRERRIAERRACRRMGAAVSPSPRARLRGEGTGEPAVAQDIAAAAPEAQPAAVCRPWPRARWPRRAFARPKRREGDRPRVAACVPVARRLASTMPRSPARSNRRDNRDPMPATFGPGFRGRSKRRGCSRAAIPPRSVR